MKRTPLRRRAKLRARKSLQRRSSLQRTPSTVATDAQRAAVAGRCCVVCGADRRIDPAHLIRARWAAVATRFASPPFVVGVTAPTTGASWTCCRTWSRRGGRRLPMRSGTSG